MLLLITILAVRSNLTTQIKISPNIYTKKKTIIMHTTYVYYFFKVKIKDQLTQLFNTPIIRIHDFLYRNHISLLFCYDKIYLNCIATANRDWQLHISCHNDTIELLSQVQYNNDTMSSKLI